MVTNLAVEPVSSGATNLMDYRYRPAMGERTLLQDSAQKAPTSAKAGNKDRNLPFERQTARDEQPIEVERNRTADFAAAVIAGTLAPTPQSMEELLRRIGSSEIPEESQARLKDLLA
ncbi:hypothetical protein NIM87_08440 [Devosia sp. XJ19-1]|uniref:Uncharacterized protein n=1 Tax=Devosia ureilytica TaxID=2952754 RepID=A0A9Q4AP40_9HYPH|nr:hypothetical protein [Devosia ureilytica]MCP8883524.1 hypothetical protein [Devosia ureilytica]MCP8887132.1 hypothetical protein [Devosia ureilytica]